MHAGLNNMRKAARKGDIELLYFDEAGFSCLPNVQRSCSPLCKPHSADASVGHKRANVMGALNYALGTLAFDVHEHTICRQGVVNFLDKQARHSARDKLTFVVMDNASIHHNIELRVREEWLVRDRFVMLFLPAYSPELSLIKVLWKQAKYHWRAFTTWTRKDLRKEVQALFDGFGSKFNLGYA